MASSGEMPRKRKRITPTLLQPGELQQQQSMMEEPVETITETSSFRPEQQHQPHQQQQVPSGQLQLLESHCNPTKLVEPRPLQVAIPAAGQLPGERKRWASDHTGRWEVRVEDQDIRDRTFIRCLRGGNQVWELQVVGEVLQLAVEGGFVVFVVGHELHIMHASQDTLVLPPVVLESQPVYLTVATEGRLLVLCRDASLSVWDLHAVKNCVRTSLHGLCGPQDVEFVRVKPQTGEPIVGLRSGESLVFRKSLESWVCLPLSRAMLAASDVPAGSILATSKTLVGSATSGEGNCLESELLTSICLGDPTQVKERLRALVLHLVETDTTRLRQWCASVIGRGPPSLSATWAGGLSAELCELQLDGIELLREVAMPVLHNATAPPVLELRAELEELLVPPSQRSELSAVF